MKHKSNLDFILEVLVKFVLVLLGAVVLSLVVSKVSASENASAYPSPEERAQQFLISYEEGDIHSMVKNLSPTGSFRGQHMDFVIMDFYSTFLRSSVRQMVLHDVVVTGEADGLGGRLSAWVSVTSDRSGEEEQCGGPLDIWFNLRGQIQRFEHKCLTDPEWVEVHPGMVDPALTGQAADIATTGAGLAMGFSEANPIANAAGPIVLALKLSMSHYAETLPEQDCMALKDGLTTVGWGAAGWNACVMVGGATSGAGLIPCLATAVIAGHVASGRGEAENLARCRASVEGRRFSMIDSTGIYE
jgi:hypothetical protein